LGIEAEVGWGVKGGVLGGGRFGFPGVVLIDQILGLGGLKKRGGAGIIVPAPPTG